jgi:hypothetical protein
VVAAVFTAPFLPALPSARARFPAMASRLLALGAGASCLSLARPAACARRRARSIFRVLWFRIRDERASPRSVVVSPSACARMPTKPKPWNSLPPWPTRMAGGEARAGDLFKNQAHHVVEVLRLHPQRIFCREKACVYTTPLPMPSPILAGRRKSAGCLPTSRNICISRRRAKADWGDESAILMIIIIRFIII